jgi:hypothetical protein
VSGGPVLPLYLNIDETLTLAVAAGLLLGVTEDVLSDRAGARLREVLDRPASLARLDQLQARSADRAPMLRSLITALTELSYALERTEHP